MYFDFTLLPDGAVRWHGMATGKTTLVARNDADGLMAFYIAGHSWWGGRQGHYAPAKFEVHKVEFVGTEGNHPVYRTFDMSGRMKFKASVRLREDERICKEAGR